MLFFVVVFCWSWSFWLLAAALRISVLAPEGRALLLLGVLGPMVGGIGAAWLARKRGGWREYWTRLFDPRRIGIIGWTVSLLLLPILAVLALVLAAASGDQLAFSLSRASMDRSFGQISTAATFLLSVFVLGPLPEELGWRGYALDHLQATRSPMASALILGLIWAAWHTPLFLMKDMLHWTHGAGSPWFWLFMTQVLCLSVVMTWLYNRTRRSILAPVLLHFTGNLAAALANATNLTNLWSTFLLIATAIVIGQSWRRSPS